MRRIKVRTCGIQLVHSRDVAVAPGAAASLRPAELITALARVTQRVSPAVQKGYPCCVTPRCRTAPAGPGQCPQQEQCH